MEWRRVLYSGELPAPRKVLEEAGVSIVTFLKEILVWMGWGVVGAFRSH